MSQPYPTEENGSFQVKHPPIKDETPSAERKALESICSIMLATKTIFPQAKTEAQQIELLQAVIQALLETLDEGGVQLNQEVYSATVLGLSNIIHDEGWSDEDHS